MNFKSRIDKLEKAIDEIQFAEKGVRVIFQGHDQTSAEALDAAGLSDHDGLIIIVRHFSESQPGSALYTAPDPESVAEIDGKNRAGGVQPAAKGLFQAALFQAEIRSGGNKRRSGVLEVFKALL